MSEAVVKKKPVNLIVIKLMQFSSKWDTKTAIASLRYNVETVYCFLMVFHIFLAGKKNLIPKPVSCTLPLT